MSMPPGNRLIRLLSDLFATTLPPPLRIEPEPHREQLYRSGRLPSFLLFDDSFPSFHLTPLATYPVAKPKDLALLFLPSGPRSLQKAAKDGTTKMSTSSFGAGSISDGCVPRMSLEVPPKDNVPKTIGKKQSVLGLGLSSSLRFGTVRFGTVRSAASTTTSSTIDTKEERPPTGTVKRTSVSSTMSLNLLTSHHPSSAISNSSSLRPPSTASGMSWSSSSSASVKWDEE